MSVNPGFGGQTFIPAVLDKIEYLREIIEKTGSNIEIEVDGGIKVDNAAEVVSAGADVLVVGSGIFSTDNYKNSIMKLKNT